MMGVGSEERALCGWEEASGDTMTMIMKRGFGAGFEAIGSFGQPSCLALRCDASGNAVSANESAGCMGQDPSLA